MSISETELNKLKKISRKPYFLKKNFLSPKNLSVPYFQYRLLRPLFKAYYKAYKKVKGPTPWTSPASIEIFNHWLTKDKIGFEWGSGSSTLFFANRLKKLISVEHNSSWFNKVSEMLQKKDLSNVDYNFIAVNFPDKHLDKDGFQKAITEAQVKAYEEYFSFIDQFPAEHFDFILIDGRARLQCGEHAISKLKSGGMLVLDNSERPRYQALKEKLASWPSIWTTNGLTDTTIWFKK